MKTFYSEQNKTAQITHSFAVANTELNVIFSSGLITVSVWFGENEYTLFSSPCELNHFADALSWALDFFTDTFISNLYTTLVL